MYQQNIVKKVEGVFSMENYQIFVSYRRDGGDALAGRIADRLTARGYKVFFDVESMRSGTFNTQILEAISKCQDVLVILPPNALDRCGDEDDWVRQELAFAFRSKKNVIPVLMRGFIFPESVPEEIGQIKYMEGVVASTEYFDAVLEKIEKLLTCKRNVAQNDIALKYQSFISSTKMLDYLEVEKFFADDNDVDVSGGVFYICNQVLQLPDLDDDGKREFGYILRSLKTIYKLAEKQNHLEICAFMQAINKSSYVDASNNIKDYMVKNINALTGEFVDYIFQSLSDYTSVDKREFLEHMLKEIFILYRCARQDF